MRVVRRIGVWLAFALVAFAEGRADAATTATLTVLLTYEHPAVGRATLTLDYAAPFDARKPTVLVIADGQQFYVRSGAMRDLRRNIFGDAVNVVGIVTRGTTPTFVRATLDASGRPDWRKAWQIFNSEEWIDDIESVRKKLVGANGSIELYGRSGGAYLVEEYLARYGEHVRRAIMQSAVNPYVNAELGIGLDLFWSDLGHQDRNLQKELLAVLAARPRERLQILMTLQRQHFFVSADDIAEKRAALIHAMADGRMEIYREARRDYQVDALAGIYASNDIVAQDVRVLELIAPSGAFDHLNDGRLYPLAETQAIEIAPLLALWRAGAIHLTPFDFASVHRCPADVFVLAGRYDEAVDYRTEIALAFAFPKHVLFVADDNHVMSKLAASGTSERLVSTFLADGPNARDFFAAEKAARAYRWFER